MKDSQRNKKSEENLSEDEIIFDDMEHSSESQKKIAKLKEKLAVCEEEKNSYLNNWQRAQADFLNLRKKDEEIKNDAIKYAKLPLLEELVRVLDSFDMAFSNKETWENAPKEWRTGVEYIYSQLLDTTKGHGLLKIDTDGQIFDPAKHEAIEVTSVTKKEDDHRVLRALQPGYTLHGKVVRAAKVVVGQFESEKTA